MKQKISTIILICLALTASSYLILHDKLQKTEITPKKQGYYTCSMHPNIKENKATRCPICGMNLTYIEAFSEATHEHHIPMSVSTENTAQHSPISRPKIETVRLTNKQVKNFRYTTFTVRREKISHKLRLLGKVVQSEKKQSNIPARISGRVEKVYINSTGSFISKNDPVIDIYSPELITAGEEYLVSYKTKQQDLLKQAKDKLILWGIQDFQIKQWQEKGEIPRNITIYSDVNGVVTTKRAVEGRYFKEGDSFYDLVNLSSVWIEMDVYEQDASLVGIGQNVSMEFIAYPGEKWTSKIDFISPILDEKTRTLKIRTTLNNKEGKLKPGMVGEINLISDTQEDVLIVPNSAIIDTGKRKIIWRKKDENNYIATNVATGLQNRYFSEVKSGLTEGDEIVIDGNFLLDAQSQLSGNNIVHKH